MSQRVLGFSLVSVAIIATFLAFTLSDYTARAGFAWNLQNAYVLRETAPCPPPQGGLDWSVPKGCPWTLAAYQAPGRARFGLVRDGVRLGYVLAGTSVVALVGIGLLVFGKSSK